ncbi:cellulose biosynthesis protein BcsE [Burkholderia thailandensis]|uniref:cellulose biosynthesis protein BcsE n=1 Tax=Burkholderia thailandensis TaxID=57975 RepID=UPI0003ECA275|nr:cellulose biosynthesis protein BcsE [Burkholderia thailandensis]AHI67065.1 cellulose biosynthesis protein BcsE [Burkholderia thailandensis H0587]AOJ53418.1 cellulose biosynthesis protein BcsE [Burkholderia thailandensis]AVR28456.1 cellulose biosynthesis protein BcsE [Burkholderia thailandensis]MCZ2894887.1 cellulose biosynthesis protein BcsE [Burkholderia thailandensis]
MNDSRLKSANPVSVRPASGAADGGALGRLRALWRAWSRAAMPRERASAMNRLAIDALPDEWTELAPGGLYAVYAAARTSACDALIWESVRHARTRDVTVVLARERADAAARLREIGFVEGVHARGWPRRLNVLAMPAGDIEAPSAARAGTADAAMGAGLGAPAPAFARLVGGLRALKRYRFRTEALYFVEGAQRWFSWHDPVALTHEGRALAGWCRSHRIALVLLIDPQAAQADASRADAPRIAPAHAVSAAHDDTRGDDRAADRAGDRTGGHAAPFADDGTRAARGGFHGACAGVAQLQRTHGELRWRVDFWRSRGGVAAGEVRALRFTGDARLAAVPAAGAHAARGDARLAFDETRVVVSRRAIERESWVPGDWDIVDDNDAVLAACDGAHAATAVLAFTGRAQLEALCATIHALRLRCGGALKIVVVERGEAMRHQFERLALNLGANQVVARDLPFSRVLAVLRSLQGQLHARPVAADYRAALAASLGDAVLGYLPVGAFCSHARAVLERGAVLALSHTLVKLTLLPGVAHAHALRVCKPRRAGDVLTADAQHLYLFLFACELADANDVLGHLFDVPVERISDRVVHLAQESIERELNALDAANRRAPIADYSDLFSAAAAAAGGPGARGAADEPATERDDDPSAERAPRESTPTGARAAAHAPPARSAFPASHASHASPEAAQIVVPPTSPIAPIGPIGSPGPATPTVTPHAPRSRRPHAAGAIARTRTRTATRDAMPLRIREAE